MIEILVYYKCSVQGCRIESPKKIKVIFRPGDRYFNPDLPEGWQIIYDGIDWICLCDKHAKDLHRGESWYSKTP